MWCDTPCKSPEDQVICMFAEFLPNHHGAKSREDQVIFMFTEFLPNHHRAHNQRFGRKQGSRSLLSKTTIGKKLTLLQFLRCPCELVSVPLAGTQRKETVTNVKIVDLPYVEARAWRDEELPEWVTEGRVSHDTSLCNACTGDTGYKQWMDHTNLWSSWIEYRGTRYYDGDSALVVELWLYRVPDDSSGLTFQEWDPSTGTNDTSVPVAMIVNSTELHIRHGLPPPGSEVSTTRLGGWRRSSYAWCGSEKDSGCG